jgi:hypothetical protein
MRGRGFIVCVLFCGSLALALAAVARADVGFRGPAYAAGTSGSPTGSKPESKLWFHDGFWWASMFDVGSRNYHIFRLNRRLQRWRDTGVALDTRPSTRADVLAVGNRLFVASHKFQELTRRDNSPMIGDAMRLYRYRYNPRRNRYSREGISVINRQRSETLVIGRGSAGALWATWVQEGGGGQHQVYVKRTVGNCVWGAIRNCDWGGARVVAPDVSSDDISSLVRFGTRIGVMWTDTSATAGMLGFRFAQGASWSNTETVIRGAAAVDDHINLKADSAGRVYAVTKTKFSSAGDPGILLHLRRLTGRWSTVRVSNAPLRRTRPIVVLDQAHNAIRVFEATQSQNAIFMKRSRLSSPSFRAARPGRRVLQDVGRRITNPTSTKQNVTDRTQLIVLATTNPSTSTSTRHYWHAYQQIAWCISGNARPNTLTGTNGNDRICGGRGDDRITGLGGNDRLTGGPGNDTLVGNTGRDAFFGRSGRDTIFARDRFRDRVDGGTGIDRARVNPSDIRRSIENLF